jgi:O-antigen ligase
MTAGNFRPRLAGNGGSAVAASGQMPRIKLDPLRLSLFLLTVINISAVHQNFPILAILRPALLLTMVAFGYAWLNPKLLNGDKWAQIWPARVVIGLGILACLSAIFGISLGRAGRFILEDYSKELIFCFLIMATIRGIQELYLYIWAYVAGTGALVWMSLFVFGIERPRGDGFVRIAGAYKYDSNDICVILMVGMGLTLLTLQTSRLFGKIVSFLILIGIGLTVAKTGSRGGFLGICALGIALLFCLHRVAVVKRGFFVGLTALCLTLAAPPHYWEQMSTVLQPKQDYNWNAESGRRKLWKRGIGYMLEYPFFGIGVDNFPRAEVTISPLVKSWHPGMPGIRMAAPHNSYVQASAEMGIPGGLLFIALVGGGFIAMFRLSRRLPRSWATGTAEQRTLYMITMYLPVSIAGFAASSFFVSFAYSTPVYLLAAYMVGVYLCLQRMQRQGTDASTPPSGLPRPAAGQVVPAYQIPGQRGGLVVQPVPRHPGV